MHVVNGFWDREKQKRRYRKMSALLSMLKRFARASLSILIAGWVAHMQQDPKWLVLAPIIQAAAKYIRQKFGLTNVPL